ncbi:hypothetical protein SAMD00019534_117590, partial [Acytostelium subglobosum LB1]|uniref:hypothetical protein n=1 Tax=Acytostelium subglobosum LB1 TaxID=1410327 RepID=UPI000644B579
MSLHFTHILIICMMLITLAHSNTLGPKCNTCVDHGKECGNDNQVCTAGTYCVNVNPSNQNEVKMRCLNVTEIDGNIQCTNDTQCPSSMTCILDATIENIILYCRQSNYRGLGDHCQYPYQCSGLLMCFDGICSNKQYPRCNSVAECHSNQTCLNSYCVQRSDEGAGCLVDTDCQANFNCIPTVTGNTSTCQSMFSRVEGQPCHKDFDCDLSLGLQCNGGFCQKPVTGIECGADNMSSCNVSSSCICDATSGVGSCHSKHLYSKDCKDQYLKYVECSKSSGCPSVDVVVAGSCLFDKCMTCDYQKACYNSDVTCGAGGACLSGSSTLSHPLSLIIIFLLLTSSTLITF